MNQILPRMPPAYGPPEPGTVVRPEFVAEMQRQLEANVHKGAWPDWRPAPQRLLAEIEYHGRKLREAVLRQDPAAVTEYSADVAALCMKCAELYGSPPGI